MIYKSYYRIYILYSYIIFKIVIRYMFLTTNNEVIHFKDQICKYCTLFDTSKISNAVLYTSDLSGTLSIKSLLNHYFKKN